MIIFTVPHLAGQILWLSVVVQNHSDQFKSSKSTLDRNSHDEIEYVDSIIDPKDSSIRNCFDTSSSNMNNLFFLLSATFLHTNHADTMDILPARTALFLVRSLAWSQTMPALLLIIHLITGVMNHF